MNSPLNKYKKSLLLKINLRLQKGGLKLLELEQCVSHSAKTMTAGGIASEGLSTPHPISGERQRSEVSKQQECPESWSSDA